MSRLKIKYQEPNKLDSSASWPSTKIIDYKGYILADEEPAQQIVAILDTYVFFKFQIQANLIDNLCL